MSELSTPAPARRTVKKATSKADALDKLGANKKAPPVAEKTNVSNIDEKRKQKAPAPTTPPKGDQPNAKPAKAAAGADETPQEIDADRKGQLYLDGQKPVEVPALNAAANSYANNRDTRIKYGGLEKKDLELVTALMNKHNLAEYHSGDIHITADNTPKFKVKIGAEKETNDTPARQVEVLKGGGTRAASKTASNDKQSVLDQY